MKTYKEQADILKIIAHPIRLEIIDYLTKGPSCANKTNEIIPNVSQPNMSQHLNLLKKAGVIDSRIDGTRRCYFICRPNFVKGLLELLKTEHPYQACQKPEQ